METSNEKLVRGYFERIVDGRSADLRQFFAEDCVIRRAELPAPINGVEQLEAFLGGARFSIERTDTTIHQLLADGDTVLAHLEHTASFRAPIRTPWGLKDVSGKQVTWSAFARFRCERGKIAEEWVIRDEVAIFKQLGFLDDLRAVSPNVEETR